MTSVSQQQQIPTQVSSSASQSAAPVQSSQSAGGPSSQQAAASGRGNVTRKPSVNNPGNTAHGKTGSISPANGKSSIPPAVPALGGPIIVNGNNAVSPTSYSGDHSRKPSVTISASGATGQMPNGGPVAGKPAQGNPIQFGSLGASSPAISNSTPHTGPAPSGLAATNASNPRITSPQVSPSPIPQPPASGGRPPSSLHGQGNGMSFGSMGDDPSRHPRPGMPSGSLTPSMQPSHLRRESSQSSHNDMGNSGTGHNGGRGGFANQGGRGRGGYQQYPQQQQQMPYSPNPSFRQVPQAPRGGQGMPSPYQAHRSLATPSFPHSPHQAARSPSLPNALPIHPQNGQIPPGNQQMPQTPYGTYQPMPQQYQYPYDPSSGFYSPYGVPQGMPMQYMPNSPHPQYQGHQIQYVPGQYNQAPQPMSRTPSGVSDRPGPNVIPPHTPMTPAANHQPSPSRGTNSPAPNNSNFKIPPKKTSAAIQIRDPNSRNLVSFDKPPKSPATVPTSKSPANVSATPTPPPPQTPSAQPESQHSRTDSQSLRGGADLGNQLREQIQKKIKADEEAEKRAKDEEASKQKETEKAEAKVEESKPEPVAKVEPVVAAEAPVKEESKAPVIVGDTETDAPKAEASQEASKEASKEAPKEEPSEDVPPEEDEDSDEYWAKIEAEEARKEQEREEAYQKKKAVEKEAAAKREAEKAARLDEELKRAEREADEREQALEKARETAATDDAEKQDLFKALKKSDNAFQATQTPPTIETPSGSGSATPVLEASATMGPPASRPSGTKQKPLPLKLETTKQVEQPQPSAALQSLRSARFLTAINDKTYPPAIASPNPALNSAAPMGKFRYDKNFLMQFQNVFVEKPSETWTDKVKETVGDTSDTPASARPGRGSGAMTARSASSRGSVLPGSFGGGSAFGQFTNARTLPPGTTSQARYEASLAGGKAPVGGTLRYNANAPGPFGMGGFGQPMSRTASSTSMSGHPQSPRNSPSHRGSGRGSKAGKRENDKEAKTMPLTAGQEVKPIEVSASGWKPHSVKAGVHAAGPPPGGEGGYLAPDVVQRKVKAALNKMTPTTFDKIANQILEVVSQSKKETDGRTLRQVIQLTFEKATDEAHWAQMYAQFCSRMLQFMTPEIKDETLPHDKNDQIISGVNLFRKYLLNRCQQDFEAGWKSKLPDKPEGGESEEAVMLSDEYYAAAAAKRRGLGLVRFIGELFKLGMLTSRIMHMCVKRLVDFEGMPDEAEVESLTSLLRTIGEALDSEEKARRGMDAYFARINQMIELEGLPSRLKFMLMDVVDLRRKGWKGKDSTKGPATIEEVRNQAAEAERVKEMQRLADNQRRGGGGGGRMGSGRGDARYPSGGGQFQPPADYQKNTVGMDDLRRLGRGNLRASGQAPTSLGPTSMFNTRGSNTRRSMGPGSILARGGEDSGASSRTATPPAQREKKEREEKEAATHANAFSALAALNSDEANDHTTSPPSSSPPVENARPNIDRSAKGDA